MVASALWIFFILLLVSLTVLRPQRKRHDERAMMLSALQRGDDVYTADGIHARVDKLKGESVVLSCYPQGVRLAADLGSIARVEGYDAKAQRRKLKQAARENAKSQAKSRR